MSVNEAAIVVNTSMPEYLKGADDLTIKKRLVLMMLERRGLVTLNHNGYEQTEDVQYKEPPTEAYADGATVNYAPRDLWKQATIDWRGYLVTDYMSYKQTLMNSGTEAIVRRYAGIIPNMVKSVRNKLGLEVYVDGYASGNENRLCGAESFCGYTAGSTAAGDIIAFPSDTYRGLSTAFRTAGTWTSALSTYPNTALARDYPEGTGDPEAHYWTPILAKWDSTGWNTGVTTWSGNSEKTLRRVVQWLTHTAGGDGGDLLGMLSGDMMTGFKDAMSAKNRQLAPHMEATDLGFPDTLNFEGLALKSEYGVAAQTGFVFNVGEMELMSLDTKLITSRGPDFCPDTLGYKFSVGMFGNIKFGSPKYHAKIFNFTASG